ncbi:hypothetical protein LPB67_10650 [Undibacterium sp. Jales W-56]|uniref:hypothetical protein n=1 Tax=Undibacterium sp. Jales W-56 TaxID=2897325 RepID=UPI0021D07480|nr:hypothetical protein [Undibacterium sp. Jales W-56]MCU6434229.1 hypothetical protein [Undibacterium sp. Jales W-56]
MHITTLQSAQCYQTYLSRSAKLHLTVGSVLIKEAAISIDACAYLPQVPLAEGATYTVQRSGWFQVCAQKRCEFLIELPAPTLTELLWARVRRALAKPVHALTRRLRLD